MALEAMKKAPIARFLEGEDEVIVPAVMVMLPLEVRIATANFYKL